MLNQIVLAGNLGHDPETRYYGENQDQPVTNFSLAFRASRTRTGWIRVVCFDRLAEVAEQYLHRGARVAVTGTLDQMQWETTMARNGTASSSSPNPWNSSKPMNAAARRSSLRLICHFNQRRIAP